MGWAALLGLAVLVAEAPAAAPSSPWTGPGPLRLGAGRVLTERPGANRPVELDVPLTATFANPFDPDEVALEARVTGPGGIAFTQPGFFHVPFQRSADGTDARPDGEPGWRLRFLPTAPGTWTVVLRARDRTGRTAAQPVAIRVGPSSEPGVIRRSASDPYRFAFASGDPYDPVGLNVCWSEKRGLADYDAWFGALAAAGGNWARIWMIYWHLGLEGKPDYGSGYHGSGVYNMENAWKLDELFRLAARHDLKLMLCLDSFNELQDRPGNPAWKDNPHTVDNGGYLKRPADFWTNPTAKKLYLRKLRYVVARWGSSPDLFAWEFWNEVDGTDDHETAPIAAWHREMARALRKLDPAGHLITTSYGDPKGNPAVWKLPELDFAQAHAYNLTDTAASLSALSSVLRGYGKPGIIGEFGADVDEDRWVESHGDAGGVHLSTALFAVPLAGAAGTPMLWYWGNFVHRFNLWPKFAAVRSFLRGGDRAAPLAGVTLTSADPAQGTRAIRLVPDETGYGTRQPASAFTIGSDGTVAPAHGLSQYFYGEGKPEQHTWLKLKVDLAEPATLAVRVMIVSSDVTLIVRADGKEVLRRRIVSGPGHGEWKQAVYQEEWKIWQNLFDRDYTAVLPAGTRQVEVGVGPGDWMTFSELRLDPALAAPRPAADVYAAGSAHGALAYVKATALTWVRSTSGEPIDPLPAARLALPGLAAGPYRVELIDCADGRPVATRRQEAGAHGLVVELPAGRTETGVRVSPDAVAAPSPAELRGWRAELAAHLHQGILGFWLDHDVDENGWGFHGAIDTRGRVDPASPVSLVLQSRILWAFSAASRAYPRAAYAAAAHRAFTGLRDQFADAANGGWFWSVSADGRPLDGNKHLYAQSFALYGLCAYADAFADADAKRLALETFRTMDAKAHDAAHGGYVEARRSDWSADPGNTPIAGPGLKSTNTHLHLMESFTALFRLTGDPAVRARLEEVYGLVMDKITDPAGYAHEYFQPDWTPVPGETSYGHDVEEAWLLLDTAAALGHPGDARTAALARALVDRSLKYGWDPDRGGFFERGPAAGQATLRTKSWWEEAEGLVGLLAVYESTREPVYWRRAEEQLRVIFDQFVDPAHGEWHQGLDEHGVPAGDALVSPWKCPYHNARACLEAIARLDRLAGRPGSATISPASKP